MPQIKVGCCGFPISRQDYYTRFRLVEVQQTFYKLPRIETLARWRQQAPPQFEFAMKAPQLITHPPSSPTYRKARLRVDPHKADRYGFFRRTSEVREAWEMALAASRALAARVVLFQTPPSFSESPEHCRDIRTFFTACNRGGQLLVWEPRGHWTPHTVEGLCRELGLVYCVDSFEGAPLWGHNPGISGSTGERATGTITPMRICTGSSTAGAKRTPTSFSTTRVCSRTPRHSCTSSRRRGHRLLGDAWDSPRACPSTLKTIMSTDDTRDRGRCRNP